MGFTHRLRAWFRGERRTSTPSGVSAPSSARSRELEEFAASRRGVEAFVEPRTNLYSMTLLLVADNGEYLRRAIADRSEADALCRRHGVPVYDAAKVGYPRRMRDFQQGTRRQPVELSDLPPWPGDDPDPTAPEHDAPDQDPDDRA